MSYPAKKSGVDASIPRQRSQAIISVQELTKTYGSGYQALRGVNLEVREGEILALLGPNGAGKTTLINIVCGIVRPSSGSVRVSGHDILLAGIAVCVLGLLFGLWTYNAVKKLPVHRSMA